MVLNHDHDTETEISYFTNLKKMFLDYLKKQAIMFLVGLTGGIATGKSSVACILRSKGVEVIGLHPVEQRQSMQLRTQRSGIPCRNLHAIPYVQSGYVHANSVDRKAVI